MIRSWSDEPSLDRVEPIRKDAPMHDVIPASCKANDLWIRETLAEAERHHARTRASAVPGKPAAIRFALQWPRISKARRLLHSLPRPA
jgi:hypothetical protein